MNFKSLKINIVLNIGILLIAGMLITDFIVISIFKNELLKAELSKTDIIFSHIKKGISKISVEHGEEIFIQKYLSGIIKQSQNHSIFFFNSRRKSATIQYYRSDTKKKNLLMEKRIKNYCLKAVKEKKRVTDYFGSTWGVFWKESKYAVISYPLEPDMGISFVVALDSVYSSLRQKQKIILFYILFNTVFLCFIGLIRFSKIIIKPIKKLTNIVKGYDGSNDALYMLNSADNEFGLLTTSLNSMVNRISEDKQKLENNLEELKKAQNEMIKTEKMASIGKLSAGVAHEIGNPIGIVLGYLELLKQNNISDDEKSDFLKRSETEIQRIDRIIKQLLNLSRKGETEHKANSVHEIIQDTVNILKVQPIFSEIDLRTEFKAGNDTIICNGDQLKQVFINIILNAADAILSEDSAHGVITIATIEAEQKYNSSLLVKISDNGPGIREKDVDRVFDPFYTTKEPGAGTGLGLWVSYMIIDEINGNIKIERIGDRGTCFTITMPVKGLKE